MCCTEVPGPHRCWGSSSRIFTVRGTGTTTFPVFRAFFPAFPFFVAARFALEGAEPRTGRVVATARAFVDLGCTADFAGFAVVLATAFDAGFDRFALVLPRLTFVT